MFPGSGRSALRPGVARLGGVVPAAGSAHVDSAASIWRAERCIRDRACRWRRCRAVTRRRRCCRIWLRPRRSTRRLRLVVRRRDQRRWRQCTDRHRLHRQRVLALLRRGPAAGPGRPARPRQHQRHPLHAARQALGHDGAWPLADRPLGHAHRDRPQQPGVVGPSADHRHRRMDVSRCRRRMRGTVTVDLGTMFDDVHALDAHGRHAGGRSRPVRERPCISTSPRCRWRGRAYVDMNAGTEPLEAGFRNWTLVAGGCRRRRRASSTTSSSATAHGVAWRSTIGRTDRSGTSIADPVQGLPRTGWRVSRSTRAAAERPARVVAHAGRHAVLQPLAACLRAGRRDAQRDPRKRRSRPLPARWVQMLLPFKMPRRAG